MVLKIVGRLLVVLILAAIGFYAWAAFTASRKLSRTYAAHVVEFPIPFPLNEGEVQSRRLTPDSSQRLARAQAVERGRHLVEARYGCGECHGSDFSGGVMVDDPAIGRLLGPNITTGNGGRTAGYRAADWDRIVRHGIKPDGRPALMPSQDFRGMSDQELSDIASFLQSQPPRDSQVPSPTLGPLGKVLLATGKLILSADAIGSHDVAHAVKPPEAKPTVEFGRHLAGACTGCHRESLAGGPIIGGDPAWPPAADLRPQPSGLGGWTYRQFVTAMREGKRPDGTALRAPMSSVLPYARKTTDVEMEALWMYLKSLPVPASDQGT